MAIQVLRWRDFQHYKKRRPPWIRLYPKLIESLPYRMMSAPARCLLVDLWMLASKTLDGCIQESNAEVAWQLRMSEDEFTATLAILAAVTDQDGSPQWLTLSTSNALAPCQQVAVPRDRDRDRAETEFPAPKSAGNWTRKAVELAQAVPVHYEPKRMLAVLSRLVKRDGPEKVLARWAVFLESGRHFDDAGKFVNTARDIKCLTPERFTNTYDDWAPSTARPAA